MKRTVNFFICAFFLVAAHSATAQNAESLRKQLYDKYSAIPNYKVNVTYEANNDNLGFNNVQQGSLTVVGEKYLLNFGPDEKWVSDGKTEYVGTRETDHSQILMFCPGQNTEAIIDYKQLLSFYGSGYAASMEGGMLKLVPSQPTHIKEIHIKASGDSIEMIKAIDELGTEHIFTISGFTTSTAGTKFTINKNAYAEKIDERSGCK
jgi:hypothetical protein